MSGVRGTKDWTAPEHIRLLGASCRGSKPSDIFSAGLVFFYFLKKVHPFGEDSEIESNIKNNQPVNIDGINYIFFIANSFFLEKLKCHYNT